MKTPGQSRLALTVTVVFLALILTAPQVQAVVLVPGDTVALSGTTAAERPELAGAVIADEIRQFDVTFGAGERLKARVQDRVVRSDVDGTLDFYFQVFNDAESTLSIDHVARLRYTGFSTDVDFRLDGLGEIAPVSASRTDLPGVFDITFRFEPANKIDPGESSRFFFIKTDATAFDGEGRTAIGALGVGNVQPKVFQPIRAAEPGTLTLVGSGLVGLAAIGWRKWRARE